MRTTMNEIFESHMQWIVLLVFVTGLRFLLGSTAFLLEDWATTIARCEQILSVLIVLMFLVISIRLVVRQTRLLLSISGPSELERRGRVLEDGFTFDAMKSAAWFSMVLTGSSLWLLDVLSPHLTLPTSFFFKLLLFICCMSFSITYFILSRGAADEPVGHEPA